MPLIVRLWALFRPRLTSGSGGQRAVVAVLAFAAFALAMFPALGFEVVRRSDRQHRLTVPATWVIGSLIGVIAFGAVGSIDSSPVADEVTPLVAPATVGSAVQPGPTGRSGSTATNVASADPTSAQVTPTAPQQTEAALGAAPQGPTETARVVRVVDGDTIVIDRGLGEERVRYIGVDTPETVAPGSPVEWMGPEASTANKRFVGGMEVVLERDVSETDRFGRLLRYVWVRDATEPGGWLFVNLELVARGFAHMATYPPDVRYVDLFLEAQRKARNNDIGLWGAAPTPEPTPKPDKPSRNCHPSYEGACLDPAAEDYDCAGGSGNGPKYVRGPVYVVGPDVFGLDSDNDGVACES
jgi:micrococcal nuclease